MKFLFGNMSVLPGDFSDSSNSYIYIYDCCLCYKQRQQSVAARHCAFPVFDDHDADWFTFFDLLFFVLTLVVKQPRVNN